MEDIQQFIRSQIESMKLMNQRMILMQEQIENLSSLYSHNTVSSKIPLPKPLHTEGDMRDNFELFKMNWESYMKATGLDKCKPEEEQRKVNILLSAIGDEAKVKYDSFGLTPEDQITTTKVLDRVKEKLFVNTNILHERWQFHTCNQLSNETFDAYLIRLNKILDKCRFEDIPPNQFKNILLRDRIVFGVQNPELKKKLLKEDAEIIKLEDVINTCKRTPIIQNKSAIINIEQKPINKLKRKARRIISNCKFCNGNHAVNRNSCPAVEYYCDICKRRGHFEENCMQNRSNKERKTKMTQNGVYIPKTGSTGSKMTSVNNLDNPITDANNMV